MPFWWAGNRQFFVAFGIVLTTRSSSDHSEAFKEISKKRRKCENDCVMYGRPPGDRVITVNLLVIVASTSDLYSR